MVEAEHAGRIVDGFEFDESPVVVGAAYLLCGGLLPVDVVQTSSCRPRRESLYKVLVDGPDGFDPDAVERGENTQQVLCVPVADRVGSGGWTGHSAGPILC